MTKSLEERIASATFLVTAKIFIKLGIFAMICIVVAIAFGLYFKSAMAWVFPAALCIFPVALGGFYLFLKKRGALKYTVMMVTERNKNLVGGLFTRGSVSQKKYTFTYVEDGEPKSFTISRSSLFNTMTVGQTYIVLYNAARPAGADNFIEFTALEMSAEEKENMLL